MVKLGVLALQGSVEEHMACLRALNEVEPVAVRDPAQIRALDGIILPGGESTTIGKLLRIFDLEKPLKARIRQGMPAWGTCAGMILLAKEIEGEPPYLGLMDIRVRRNAYGRQIDSFKTEAIVEQLSPHPIPLVFIRAPWIESVGGEVKVLCTLNGHIVAARQENMLATSFHPELTRSLEAHRYFAGICTRYKKLRVEKTEAES